MTSLSNRSEAHHVSHVLAWVASSPLNGLFSPAIPLSYPEPSSFSGKNAEWPQWARQGHRNGTPKSIHWSLRRCHPTRTEVRIQFGERGYNSWVSNVLSPSHIRRPLLAPSHMSVQVLAVAVEKEVSGRSACRRMC
ncbi:hypothetical protein HETIRDRAFT_328000 [Heterobasidion irregulare TC 32-1]|uniref:Uncharacterized protein n=1 Tax=Heterobasidion irregulare (strain TC 32-1) TaxID=747525 RepID=W4JTS8_HETIT|nr:uncharacterized protein HETIRDRAFT_328000 [Heterobasidion irregulare TC 32-1]ETW76967.1 hypothetical protein HETIRDRAFT_328000 [Heterobasidion irregulare TC 32-1]